MANVVSNLIIRLKDDVSANAQRAGGNLGKLSRSVRDLSKAKANSLKGLTRDLDKLQDAAGKPQGLRALQKEVATSRTRFRDAQAEVKRLATEVARTEQPTRKMQSALAGAQRAVKEAARAFEEKVRAAAAMKRSLEQAIGPVTTLAGAEARLRSAIDSTTGAIRRQAQAAEVRARRHQEVARKVQAEIDAQKRLQNALAQRRTERKEIITNAGAAGAIYGGYKAREVGGRAIESAADFDIAVRKQRAFTGITQEEQDRILVPQAKQIGQETQYSNTDIVNAQTRIMQGLPANLPKAEVAAGITEQARNYALAMGADMEQSAEAIRSFLQSTQKDISTPEKALAEARRASNMMIRMGKLGGMSDEDVQQFMKYGAASGTIAGMSDEFKAAIAVGLRRSGVRGDEAGVFLRSASGKLVAPTQKGMAALAAAGIDYADYSTMPDGLSADALETKFQQDFGKSFTPDVRAAVEAVLADSEIVGDRGRFVEAVSDAVADLFPKTKKGKMAASDQAKLAKKVGEFHKLSVESVDVEGLFRAIMQKDPTLALLNAFFTDRQGGRAGILGGSFQNFDNDMAALTGIDPAYGQTIANEIMGGLGGSLERLKGSVENAILAIGTANEKILTLSFDKIGELLDSFSNLSATTQQVVTALGGLAAMGGGLWGFVRLLKTFTGAAALTGSAAALTESAAALNVAAARLSAAAGADSFPDGPAGRGGRRGRKLAGKVAGAAGYLGVAGRAGGAAGAAALGVWSLAEIKAAIAEMIDGARRHGLHSPAQSLSEGQAKLADYKRDLAELEAKLDGLRAKSRNPEMFDIANQADLFRVESLKAAISNLEAELQRLGEMGGDAGAKIPANIATGIAANAAAAEGQAQTLMDRIRAIFGVGVDIPIRYRPGPMPSAPVGSGGGGDAAIRPPASPTAAPAAGGGGAAVNSVVHANITVEGSQSPEATADAVSRKLGQATAFALRGSFADGIA